MAKKSAKSKGYRKHVEKKPYLSKKDILLTASIIAVIAAIVILFNIFYDDGSLPVENGAVVVEGENSLLYNGGKTANPKYYKLAEAGAVDGYTLEAEPKLNDANLTNYTYLPKGENAKITNITVDAYGFSAKDLTAQVYASCSSAEELECTEIATATIGGKNAHYFSYTYHNPPAEPETPDGTEPESLNVEQEEITAVPEYGAYLIAYVEASQNQCISIHIKSAAEEAEGVASFDEMYAALEQCVSALRFSRK